jgi:hypothetical protein
MLLGHVNQDAVLLARQGDEFFAIGATCLHYSGPLAEGLMAGDTVRCSGTTRCRSPRTARRIAQVLGRTAVLAWKRATQRFVRERTAPADEASRPNQRGPRPSRIASSSGGGAAGFAAAEMLRREGFGGSPRSYPLTMSCPTTGRIAPDYLAGSAGRLDAACRLSSTRNIQLTFSSAARLPQSTWAAASGAGERENRI